MAEAETRSAASSSLSRTADIVAALAMELDPDAARPDVLPDTKLDSDLGFDSLARTELVLRLQRAFHVELPDDTLLADTVGELARAVARASPGRDAGVRPRREGAPPPRAEGEPANANTLIDVLEWHVERQPGRGHIDFERDDGRVESLDYGELYDRARRAAGGLREHGVRSGDSVIIMLPSCLEYFCVFLGAEMVGALPVPIYPPARRELALDHLRRHGRIMRNAGARLLVSVPALAGPAAILQGAVPDSPRYVVVDDLLAAEPVTPRPATAEDIAFLQYTSGSTGDPKGVVVQYDALLTNIRAMGQRARVGGDDRFVSWLPLYHDMGLIGAWMCALYFSFPLYLMSPLHFLAQPVRWLRRIGEQRGTLTASPNFGYEFCLSRVSERELASLDLSSLRLALNGAEPVRPDTMRRFNERFGACGLRPDALKAVYGLAETSLGLTIPAPAAPLRIERLDREALQRHGLATRATGSQDDALELCSCGPPLDGQEVRIADETGHELPEEHEGAIEFRGPSSCRGYFRNPEATRSLFHDDWLVTGDRGFVSRGELFITGRIKDMIIRGGRNIHPTELESIIEQIEGVRRGCVACFGDTDAAGAERLVIAAETRVSGERQRDALRDAIRRHTMQLLQLPPDDIVLCTPHAIPKTSSGKIRRSDTRELYRRGRLADPSPLRARQFLTLAALAVGARLRIARVFVRTYAYSGYAWSWLYLLGGMMWLAVVLLPTRRARWRAMRAGCRAYCFLCGIRLSVAGLERLPETGNWVLACNHTSYLDSMMLLQAMPRDLTFVAKRALNRRWIQRIFLRRLGTVFVKRRDPRDSAPALDELSSRLRAGECLAVFPEGTFVRESRLLPLRLGAFLAAARTGVPVVPTGIEGVRDIMRSESWLIRRADVRLEVTAPIEPRGDTLRDAAALRAETRRRLRELLDTTRAARARSR